MFGLEATQEVVPDVPPSKLDRLTKCRFWSNACGDPGCFDKVFSPEQVIQYHIRVWSLASSPCFEEHCWECFDFECDTAIHVYYVYSIQEKIAGQMTRGITGHF